ncbi:MAG: acylphosphatase [Desulfobacterales bacterium]|nr:MAG: acylphosphatase [Desulfobacterales bacterium]
MANETRARAVISGRVQGVFFRLETRQAAQRYGVFGWVKNQMDGTVAAVFEGPKESVDSILEWCKQGPPHARVEHVAVEWEDYTGEFNSFDITY